MANLAGLSRKEKLDKRMELVKKARDMVDRAEKANADGKLRGEDNATWEALDKEIEELNDALEATPADDLKKKLAKWDADMDQDPGRLTTPTEPGSNPDLSTNGGEVLYKGQPVDLGEHQKLYTELSSKQYDQNFRKLLKSGGRPEALGMKFGEDAKGGVLASMQFVSQLIKFVDDLVHMRRLATVIPLGEAVSLGALSWDADPGDSDWTPEVPASEITEDDSARMGNREMMPHGFSKLVKMSNKLRRHHPMIVNFLIARLGYKAAVTEEKAYFTGNGNQRPLGVFVASDQGIPTSRDITTVGSLTTVFDDYIDAFFSLKEAYWPKSSWMMSRQSLKVARKLKDSSNQYLWQPAVKDGTPSTILERPYNTSEFIPGQTAAAWTAGTYVAAIGDWSNYWIADSLQIKLQILEELLALKQQTGFLMTKETDGQPVLAEAFARIALKA